MNNQSFMCSESFSIQLYNPEIFRSNTYISIPLNYAEILQKDWKFYLNVHIFYIVK